MGLEIYRDGMLVAFANIVGSKQLGEEQNGLKFLFISLFFFFGSFWTDAVMFCSFHIYNETHF